MSVNRLARNAALALLVLVASGRLAEGQPLSTLGTFSWQLQPYCNVLTLTVTQAGATYILNGFDDQCGTSTRASATGVAIANPNGTVGFGVSIVTATGDAVHVDATINLITFSGTWRDSNFLTGTFAFAASTGGMKRPPFERYRFTSSVDGPGLMVAASGNGTREAPQPPVTGQTLAIFAGAGYKADGFARLAAYMEVNATENWASLINGSSLGFRTTPNGTNDPLVRMTIAHDGLVGIGTATPGDRLDVNGDVRVGTAGTNGCLKNNNGGGITGACSSDERLKRDIISFAPALDAVAALRPVHFRWRASEFPHKAFGSQQAYGLIAQDVAAVLPELVSIDEDGYRTVDYAKLPLLAIQAIKELKEKNDALAQQLAELRGMVTGLSTSRSRR